MTAPLIIAEAGVNHNGDLGMAKEMVRSAANAGADAVKFQSFRADKLATKDARKAAYQNRADTAGESQHAMLCELELSEDAHLELRDLCKDLGIEFMSTAFDDDLLWFLVNSCRIRRVKIPSGEAANPLFLLSAAATELPIIMSTGMCTLDDVERALGVLAFAMTRSSGAEPGETAFAAAAASPEGKMRLAERVTLLHCTSSYPADVSDANLAAMKTLADAFGLPVGYSDHTQGVAVSIAAAALGATVIEKHFTMDRSLPGPDHAASIEPADLADLVIGVRAAVAAIGSPGKRPTADEQDTMAVARRSLVAARPIAKGEAFSTENLTAKRPGGGVDPYSYWAMLGQPANRSYDADEVIDP